MEQREIINTITTVLEEYLSSSTENGFLRLKKLEELLELRQKYPFWLHVGGAWGGAVVVSEILRRRYLASIEKVDSFTWDFPPGTGK